MPGRIAQIALPHATREDFPAQVVAAGPDGEADLTGNVFWVEELDCMATSGDMTDGAELDVHVHGRIVAAEWIDGADHSLAVGQKVHVFPLTDKAAAPKARWYFSLGGGTSWIRMPFGYADLNDQSRPYAGALQRVEDDGSVSLADELYFAFATDGADDSIAQAAADITLLVDARCVIDNYQYVDERLRLRVYLHWLSTSVQATIAVPPPRTDWASRPTKALVNANSFFDLDADIIQREARFTPSWASTNQAFVAVAGISRPADCHGVAVTVNLDYDNNPGTGLHYEGAFDALGDIPVRAWFRLEETDFDR